MVITTGKDLLAYAHGPVAVKRDAARQVDRGVPLDEKTLVDLRLRRIQGPVIAYRSR